MSFETFARDAFDYTRSVTPKRSPNKVSLKKKKEALHEVWESLMRVAEMQANIPRDGLIESALVYATRVQQAGEGNCIDLCFIAFSYLYRVGVHPIEIVGIKAIPSSHALIVIGRNSSKDEVGLPVDMTTWDENAYVCDVWAKIVCPVREFPQRWEQRMAEWGKKGREIYSDHLIPPGHHQWKALIPKGKKTVAMAWHG